jgi:nicotinamide-nucleotide amidase
MRCEIITIGDELLIGQVINTNQAFIAERLTAAGITVERMTSIGDTLEDIVQTLEEAWHRQEVVIVTGGLGPTHDDVTKTALCRLLKTDLVPDDRVRERITLLLRSRNAGWSDSAEQQTLVPRGMLVFVNPVGTAPGLVAEREGHLLAVLPGVPYEMRELMTGSLIPFLTARAGTPSLVHRTLRTTGIPESMLARELGDVTALLEGARLAYLPSPRGVRLRITAHEATLEASRATVARIEQRIRDRVQAYIYGVEDEELEEVVGALLAERSLTVAVAESCTGGMLADKFTNVSGSSRYFERGVIAYSNRAKTELLGVPPGLIEERGAVSREVAAAMAEGVRRAAHTAIGLSTTGIAGPTGGTSEKPVGFVWIACADEAGTVVISRRFGNDRLRFKDRASHAALDLLRGRLLGRLPPEA